MSPKRLDKAPWWFLFLGTPLLSFYIWQVLVQMENVASQGCQHSQLLSHRTVDMKYDHNSGGPLEFSKTQCEYMVSML